MESSAGRRRAPDAEQSARAHSATAECEPVAVKEEPEWGASGVSEAAAAEGLYAGHEVKDELVIGPELVQKQDIAFSMRDVLNIKEDSQHEPNQADGADVEPGCTHPCPWDGPHCSRTTEQQHSLRSCFVRLERLPEGNLHRNKPLDISRNCVSTGSSTQNKLNPVNSGVEDGRARNVPSTCQSGFTGSHIKKRLQQQYRLGYCSVRLERLTEGDLHVKAPFYVGHKCELNHSLPPSKLNPLHCGVANTRAKDVSVSCQPHHSDNIITSQSNLPKHVKTHTHEKPQESKLTRHILSLSHTDEDLYCCDACHKWFRERSALIKHIRIHSSKKPYGCDTCNKWFREKSILRKHVQLHIGVKPYVCDVCGHGFTRPSYLTVHMRQHTGEKPYSCDVCKKRFAAKPPMIRHKLIHAGEKPHNCDICNKRFMEKAWLTRHKRMHTNEKPYSCSVCNKRFTQSSALTIHNSIHSGEKRYSCNVCDNRFRVKATLNNHMRTHTREKPYSCGVCNKRFVQSTSLTSHMRIHTGEKPYSCGVCKKKLRYSWSLIKHMRIHTREKP